jgi:hypothetical protein
MKPLRQNFSSGAKWESIVGYSRAVRFASRIYVTGTTATDERSEIVGVGDPYAKPGRHFVTLRARCDRPARPSPMLFECDFM